MADNFKGITDQWGKPIEKALLTEEVAGATLSGVRSPMSSYPADGLNPQRLASILKEADAGQPLRYLELAETMEERDQHYVGVLGKRKRAVSQLPVRVVAASDKPHHRQHADMVERWVKRDGVAANIFDMLDATGKGYEFSEIIWDTSMGQWDIGRLVWRDPRWFRFERHDLTTPVLISEGGQDIPLPAFKFIRTVMKAKSGLPLRSGIARVAAWGWMFKMFTQRDWQIFIQTFFTPVRLGSYGPGATDSDRKKLLTAVSNIAADCAAIIPESMKLDFIESKNVGTSSASFKERCEWIDQQLSKLVLGGTATTDAIAGGHAVGQEHQEVAEDIERADAKEISGTLNRDMVKPWVMLEFGPQDEYPRLEIGREEKKNIDQTVRSVVSLVPLGLEVGRKQMRDFVGLGEPDKDDELLSARFFHERRPDGTPVGMPGKAFEPLPGEGAPSPGPKDGPPSPRGGEGKKAAMHGELPNPKLPPKLPLDAIAQSAGIAAGPAVDAMLAKIKAIVANAGSLEEMKAMLEAAAPQLDAVDLADAFNQALLLAELTGRAEIGAQ
jgi:phage gp29-like protein